MGRSPRFPVGFQFLISFLLVVASPFAESLPDQPFTIRWKSVEGAGGYRADVRQPMGEVFQSQTLADTEHSATFSLEPGPYELKVTTLNRLRQDESSTVWVPFHVDAPDAPELESMEPVSGLSDEPLRLTLTVRRAAQDAKAELRFPSGRKVPLTWVPRQEVQNWTDLVADEAGSYQIVITNPPRKELIVNDRIAVRHPDPVASPVEVTLPWANEERVLVVEGSRFTPSLQARVISASGLAPQRLATKEIRPSRSSMVLPPGLEPGQYRIEIGNGPDGAWIVARSVTVLPPPPPPPQRLTAFADDGRVLLSWDSVPNATGYRVYQTTGTGVAPSDRFVDVPASANPEARFFGLSNGTSYSFVVTSINGGGPGAPTPAVTATPVVSPLTPTLVEVPGGTFSNGVVKVTVTSFRMSTTEITRAQYRDVMGVDPLARQTTPASNSAQPVSQVTWFEAVEFCNRLSEKHGLSPVYTIRGTSVVQDLSQTGYRLPTEAEWQWAARGGPVDEENLYAGGRNLDDLGWFGGNAQGVSHAVASKQANELGLFDLSGNVAEWCFDWKSDYQGTWRNDPVGPSAGTTRVVRGGSFGQPAEAAEIGRRSAEDPAKSAVDRGFRVVTKSNLSAQEARREELRYKLILLEYKLKVAEKTLSLRRGWGIGVGLALGLAGSAAGSYGYWKGLEDYKTYRGASSTDAISASRSALHTDSILTYAGAGVGAVGFLLGTLTALSPDPADAIRREMAQLRTELVGLP